MQYPAQQMAEGWIAGMVIEAALKATGWPATPEKLAAAMCSLKVDTKGLRGGPIEWTKDNHFRTRQYYRVYKWDAAKGSIAAGQGLDRVRREVMSSRPSAEREDPGPKAACVLPLLVPEIPLRAIPG